MPVKVRPISISIDALPRGGWRCACTQGQHYRDDDDDGEVRSQKQRSLLLRTSNSISADGWLALCRNAEPFGDNGSPEATPCILGSSGINPLGIHYHLPVFTSGSVPDEIPNTLVQD